MRRVGLALAALVLVALLACAVAGCGRPFDVRTAPGLLELKGAYSMYDYRATTPEGVVFAVRVIELDTDDADLAFWSRAVTLQMRDVTGYALLDTKDVTSGDGTTGKELRFGHDEDGKPFAYTVRLYIAQGRLFLVESGGARAEVERFAPSLDWMQKGVRVRCGSLVSPVLASRTCNRW